MESAHSQKQIAVPTRPDFIPFTSPYVCVRTPYDYIPGGFYDFPARQGWMLYGEPGNPDAANFCRLDSTDSSLMIAEKIEFLQAWFFFGVLAEVSLISGLAINVEAEFVLASDQEDGRIVSTAPINGLAERWLTAAWRHEDWNARLCRMYELCRYVKCRMIDLRGEDWTVRSRLGWDAETKVLLSIEIVFRALLLALARSGDYNATMLEPLMKTKCFNYQLRLWSLARRVLRIKGWCQSEQRILAALNRELPYPPPLTTLNRHKMDHYACGDFRCMADQINEDTYRTLHVDSECKCEYASPSVNQLCSVLSQGKIPVVIVSGDLKLRVTTDQPYVAISHVWSHGIGNPTANAIPTCQLRRIRDSIAKLDEKFQLGLRPSTDKSYALWLDTLCIPVAPELKAYRKKSITLMGQTYHGAAAVLVLDRELRQVDSRTSTVLEQCLWLVFSGWMRRLWTLQEATLAKHLFIELRDGPARYSRFDDGAILIANKLKRELSNSATSDPIPDILMYRDLDLLIQRRIPLANHFWDAVTEGSGLQTRYQYLCAAVESRCTSKLNDEPIILAIMMRHNITEMLKEPDDERKMGMWYQSMGKVPADIIFLGNQIKTLAHAPFRWAPRSLMENEIARQTTDGVGKCDVDGLHVKFSGFMIRDGQEPCTTKVGEKWYLRDAGSGTVHKVRHEMDSTLPLRCAILFHLEKHRFGAVVKILGERVEGRPDGSVTYVVTIVGLVSFFRKLGLEPGKIMKPEREVLECARTGPAQRWCIT